MEDIVQIPLPLPHIRSVNTWLVKGEPLTLVDTGPRDDEALDALESGLRRAGVGLEDLELVLITHHHLDHSGLAGAIAERSGARIGALDRAADYGERYEERSAADRRFTLALMRHHGAPDDILAGTEPFWDYIRETSAPYLADLRLADGDRVRVGDRDLRVLARPGHSTTDALFVDDADGLAFVGDHLLARVSSNTEVYPAAEPDGTRPRARVEYLESLGRTAAMPLTRLLTGHGEEVTDHTELVRRRLGDHTRRCNEIVEALRDGPKTAWDIATRLWSRRTLSTQSVLVVWEVLGHLDLLLDSGRVSERVTDDGSVDGIADFRLRPPPTLNEDR